MATKERSTKQVVDDTRLHLKELVDAHVELAKAEMKDAQGQLVAAILPLAVAGVLGLFVLGFFGVTGAKALSLVVDEWLAWLIVSLLLMLILGILAMTGIKRLKSFSPAPTETQESVKQTVAWAKARTNKADS